MDINRRKSKCLPTTPAVHGGCAAAHRPHPDPVFERLAVDRLSAQLDDRCVAEILAPFIMDAGFNMAPPSGRIADAGTLVAFAFGNRPNANHDPNQLALPGPMNHALAQCCAAVWRRKRMPLYVQWEIARWLQESEFADIPGRDIISIEPYRDADGKLVYLSTDGVAQAIIEQHFAGDPARMGRTAVIGHRDHVKRCIMTCRARGVRAFAPQGIALPRWYDVQSDQSWTRRRDLYVLQDIVGQLSMAAQANIIKAYPQG